MKQIILASASPRRRELMTMMGLQFEVVPSDFEEWLDDSQSPEDVSMALARGKAMAVAVRHPEAIVVGSDTIVTIEGRQLAKASDDDDARMMLRLLAGKTHSVTSSLAVICLATKYESLGADTALVTFKPYDKIAVENYLALQNYHDKAAAYGIQTGAAPLVERVEGEATTIIGLPVPLLATELRNFGVISQPVSYALDLERIHRSV